MRKTLVVAIVLLAAVFAVCAQAVDEKPAAVSTHIVTDHAGYEVEVPNEIERVAVYGIYPMPSVISVFFNSADKIVAIPKPAYSPAKSGLLGKLYPEILDVDTECMSGDAINIEALMALDPQVVFISDTDAKSREILETAGIPAIGISVDDWDYNCLETLDHWIELLSEIFEPDSDKIQKVHDYSNKVYDLVSSRVSDIPMEERVRVFILFQYSSSTMMTSGKHFFGQWWCDAVGAVNVATDLPNQKSAPTSLESIYAWNPDAIVITNYTTAMPETLYTNAMGDDWSGIKAVQDKRVYKAPLGIYRSYTAGVDAPVSLVWWAKAIYPELFLDIDLSEVAKDYYKTVFGIELDDAQVASIFAPPASAAGGMK